MICPVELSPDRCLVSAANGTASVPFGFLSASVGFWRFCKKKTTFECTELDAVLSFWVEAQMRLGSNDDNRIHSTNADSR